MTSLKKSLSGFGWKILPFLIGASGLYPIIHLIYLRNRCEICGKKPNIKHYHMMEYGK